CAKLKDDMLRSTGSTRATNRGNRAMYYSAPYFITIGRVLMAIMFIHEGISKMFGYTGAQGYMEAHGVPGVLLPLVILTEAGGGLCVLLGLFTRWWAIALAGFCVLTALFFHWHPEDQMQMINFMKKSPSPAASSCWPAPAQAHWRWTTASAGDFQPSALS